MFLEKTETNPFAAYEGIYKIPLIAEAAAIKSALGKLDLEIYKNLPKGTTRLSMVTQITAIHKLHTVTKAETRLSRIFSLIGLSEKDVAKIFDQDVFNPNRNEYWELTAKAKDIDTMGNSKHWTSCYRGSAHYTDQVKAHTPMIMARQMDSKGDLFCRFIIAGNWNRYPLERSYLLGNGVGTANCKGISHDKAKQVANAFMEGKATKLEPKEIKEFSWTK